MTHPFRIANFDTSGTAGPQTSTNGLKLTDQAGAAKTVTPAASPVRAHAPVIKSTNPAGVKYK